MDKRKQKEVSVYSITPSNHLLPLETYDINPIYGIGEQQPAQQLIEVDHARRDKFRDTEQTEQESEITHEAAYTTPSERMTYTSGNYKALPRAAAKNLSQVQSEHKSETKKEIQLLKLRAIDIFVVGSEVCLVIASILLMVVPIGAICTATLYSAMSKQDLYAILLGPLVINTLALLYNFIWQHKRNKRNVKHIAAALFLHTLNMVISFIFGYRVVAEMVKLRQTVETRPLFVLDLSLAMIFVLTTITSAGLIIRGIQLVVKKAVER